MKQFCLAVIFFSLGLVYGQNIVSFTFQPTDLGYGFRYDRLFKDFGLYSGLTKGKYQLDEFYIKDHYKLSFGATIPLQYSYLSAGLSAHRYGERYGDFKKLNLVSFDLGCGVILNRFNMAFRMDFLKGEGCIDFGIKL